VTRFERTSWLVRRRDGAVVEVALDIGQIEAGDATSPICELELELKSGQPTALFEVARQIAQSMAVLPASISKAERGFALAQNRLNQPQRAQPPQLRPDMPLPVAAQRVLLEMFGQFTRNLNLLRSSDDPELVHQARVGWRRFKSAMRLFKPVLAIQTMPSWQGLQPLLTSLGELRDLDVACTETLPKWADAYTKGDPQRNDAWQKMAQALDHATELQRKVVRYALQDPTVGAALLTTTQWLEDLTTGTESGKKSAKPKRSLRQWSQRRLSSLQEKLERARKKASTPTRLHRVRLLAKRLRYGTEALRTLLPKRLAQALNQQATRLQINMGATRDIAQAAALVARMDVDRGLAEFLRGVAATPSLPDVRPQ
jgi:inorganic triphosphatase YgiF